jgi:hypothetical protein
MNSKAGEKTNSFFQHVRGRTHLKYRPTTSSLSTNIFTLISDTENLAVAQLDPKLKEGDLQIRHSFHYILMSSNEKKLESSTRFVLEIRRRIFL